MGPDCLSNSGDVAHTGARPQQADLLSDTDLSSACRSDDRLKSNFHRVAMPPREEPSASRYSIAFFNNANKNSLVQVHLSSITRDTLRHLLACYGPRWLPNTQNTAAQ